MWSVFSCFLALLLSFTFLFSPVAVYGASGVPTILSYQGRLANSSGDLLGGSGTTYYFKFSIWDNATVGSGTRLWPIGVPATTTSTVRQGVFTVNIGDTANSYPDVLDYNFNSSSDIYLQVEVSSDNNSSQTLSPRQRISASAFARLSSAVSGSTTPSSFGTTTPFGTSVVSVEATSTNTTALSLRSVLNQIANIFQVQSSTGANLLFVNSTGGFFASSTLQATGAARFFSTLRADDTITAAGGLTASGLASLANASSTLLSVTGTAYFGGTATSTFGSDGTLTLASALGASSGGTGWGTITANKERW
ncbi:MAG: putative serine-rich adhesin for platelets-like, partial [Parcubacteria group bacterium Greene0416_79]